MPTFIIKIEQLRYAYKKKAGPWVLDGLNLKIRPYEYLLICGASGSGKSTLCRTFNGLIPHFYGGTLQGDVHVAGLTTANQTISNLFVHVGMVFQNSEAQLFNRTVSHEIAFGLESLGLQSAEISRRITETAEMINIVDLLPRNPHELSGGEQQLVSIAAILATRPQLIVLDEPYANLDPTNVKQVRMALKSIQQQGITVVISEHRLPYTVADVQRMVVLHQGRIILDGPPDKVLNQDVETFGLTLPLAVHVGQRIGLDQLPLNVTELKSAAPAQAFPPDLQPVLPKPPSTEGATVLAVDRISFIINKSTILHDVSFKLHQGECIAVVGANGAGKTTLIKHLNGLNRPSQGRVKVMGQDTRQTKVSQLARHVGVAFQNPNNQFFKLSVWDEIVVGAKALDCYDEAWVKKLVRLFHLEPLLNHAPYRLSGGEKKRVAFAVALAAKPSIFIMDEPTSGQDWHFRRSLGNLLSELRELGQAILLITHDLSFAEQHAHRWLLLAEGQVVAEGPPWQVMANETAMRRASLEPTEAFQLYA